MEVEMSLLWASLLLFLLYYQRLRLVCLIRHTMPMICFAIRFDQSSRLHLGPVMSLQDLTRIEARPLLDCLSSLEAFGLWHKHDD